MWIAIIAATAMLAAKNTKVTPLEVSGSKTQACLLQKQKGKEIPEGKRKTN